MFSKPVKIKVLPSNTLHDSGFLLGASICTVEAVSNLEILFIHIKARNRIDPIYQDVLQKQLIAEGLHPHSQHTFSIDSLAIKAHRINTHPAGLPRPPLWSCCRAQ